MFLKFIKLLNDLSETHKIPVVVSTHPRTKKRIESLNVKFHKNVILQKPLGFFDYVKLQINARAVLSDSGTISEESSILNFPALNLREAHERPEAMEEGSVMMVGLDSKRVLQALQILELQKRGEDRTIYAARDYCVQNVSHKIVRIIHSYTDYVKRVVWRDYF